MLNDEEYAEVIESLDRPASAGRISEWSTLREGVAQVVDQLRVLTAVMAGGDVSSIEPVQRPKTMLDRVQKRDKQRRYENLLANIFGQRH